MQPEKQLTEKESLDLIAMMINRAKDSYHDTGAAAIMWGVIITICSLVRLSELQFGYRLPVDIYWLTIVAIIPQVLISIREKKERKVKTYDDIFLDYLWFGFGISIFLMIFITNVLFNAQPAGVTEDETRQHVLLVREFIAPLFLLLYGMPTFVTGAAFKFKQMLWGGVFCWVCCIVTLFTPIKIDLVLTAASAIFAWLVPGIMMEKDYRQAKRELASNDV